MHKIKWALLAFTITFCAPALIAQSFQYYMKAGSKLGEFIFSLTHTDTLN